MTSPLPFNLYSNRLVGPGAVQQEVDQNGNVGDGYTIHEVAVSVLEADAGCITIQQVVDQGGNVVDGNFIVHVNEEKSRIGTGH